MSLKLYSITQLGSIYSLNWNFYEHKEKINSFMGICLAYSKVSQNGIGIPFIYQDYLSILSNLRKDEILKLFKFYLPEQNISVEYFDANKKYYTQSKKVCDYFNCYPPKQGDEPLIDLISGYWYIIKSNTITLQLLKEFIKANENTLQILSCSYSIKSKKTRFFLSILKTYQLTNSNDIPPHCGWWDIINIYSPLSRIYAFTTFDLNNDILQYLMKIDERLLSVIFSPRNYSFDPGVNVLSFDIETSPMNNERVQNTSRIPTGMDIGDVVVMISYVIGSVNKYHQGSLLCGNNLKTSMLDVHEIGIYYVLPYIKYENASQNEKLKIEKKFSDKLHHFIKDDHQIYTGMLDKMNNVKTTFKSFWTEKDMIESFIQNIVTNSIIITGYNIMFYDLPCIYYRLLWFNSKYLLYFDHRFSTPCPKNAIILDAYKFVEKFGAVSRGGETFKLNVIAEKMLKRGKIDINVLSIHHLYNAAQFISDWDEFEKYLTLENSLECHQVTDSYITKFLGSQFRLSGSTCTFTESLFYALVDSILAFRIFDCSEIFSFLVEYGNLCNIGLEQVLLSGNSRLLPIVFIFQGESLGYFINYDDVKNVDGYYLLDYRNIPIKQTWSNIFDEPNKSFQGALTFASPGIYENVVMLDFKSLYPSVIIHLNITFECFAIISKQQLIALEKQLPNWKAYYDIKPFNIHDPVDMNINLCIKHNTEYYMIYFKNIKGFFAACLNLLIKKRDYHKMCMKNESLTISEINKHNNLQKVLKVMANSGYGLFGALYTSNLKNETLGRSVAQFGRECLLNAVNCVLDMKLPVMYMDTDSVFVELRKKKDEENLNEKQLVDKINQFIDTPDIIIQCENTVKYFICLSKKKYILFYGNPLTGKCKGMQVKSNKVNQILSDNLIKSLTDSVPFLNLYRISKQETNETLYKKFAECIANISINAQNKYYHALKNIKNIIGHTDYHSENVFYLVKTLILEIGWGSLQEHIILPFVSLKNTANGTRTMTIKDPSTYKLSTTAPFVRKLRQQQIESNQIFNAGDRLSLLNINTDVEMPNNPYLDSELCLMKYSINLFESIKSQQANSISMLWYLLIPLFWEPDVCQQDTNILKTISTKGVSNYINPLLNKIRMQCFDRHQKHEKVLAELLNLPSIFTNIFK
jgi:DNA polymerase elongation subunit (family B)